MGNKRYSKALPPEMMGDRYADDPPISGLGRRFTFNPDMEIAPKTFSAPGVAATAVARP